jgi:outer membrane protein OmpA-like peptidoglycan-associated protein
MSRSVALIALASFLCCPALTRAQAPGFAVNQLDLSERGSEWFATDSLDLRGDVRPAIGLVADWAYRPLVLNDDNGDFRRSIVRSQVVLHPGASLVLFDRLRLAIDVPIQAYADGHTVTLNGITVAGPADKTSLGDLRLGATVRLFGEYGDVITGAIGLQVSLPTGARESYAGDGNTRITPQFLIAGDIAWFVYAASAGVTIRTIDEAFERTQLGPYANLAVSAGVRTCQGRLVFGPEVFMHSVLTHGAFFKKRSTPVEGLIGLHYMLVDGLRVGAGIGTGLSAGYGTPDRRGLLMVEWAPKFKKKEPEPADRDHDGILDEDDACPDTPGVASDDPSKHGCPPPPPDRDHDGILDRDDACPDEPGERSDDPAKNGCPPPPDRDHDGIVDTSDACPDVAGPASDDPAKNGCPPPSDRDHDGIIDEDDACPDEPGKPNAAASKNGCPRAVVREQQIRILDQVKFKTNSAEIDSQASEEVLQAVLGVLTEHPELEHVRVEGHTDNTGRLSYNKQLSKSRAQSVVTWLKQHGIASSRLSFEGYGPERPIDTNDTEAGKSNNRRVEFHIEAGKR